MIPPPLISTLFPYTTLFRSYYFLLCQRERVKEGLHRGLAEAPAALMRAPMIVIDEPGVEVSLQLVDRLIDLFAKGDPVELVEDGAMKALANAIGLRALGLGAAVVDVLNGEIELVFMALGAAKLGAAIGQHARQTDAVLVIKRHHPIIEDLGRGDRGLAIVEFGERDLGIGVDKGLLIDPPDALQRSDIEGVLRAAIARALAVELAMRLLVGLGLLERGNLRFGEQHAFLCHLDLERLEAVLHRGQIVTLPDAAHAGGRDRQAAALERLRHAHLPPGRLINRQSDHRLFDLDRRAVLQHRLAAADLLQS